MTLLSTVIFSVIEGLTEFLPISSTAHLLLTAEVLAVPQTEVLKTFIVAIQSGAILAVVVLFGRRLLRDRRTLLLTLTAFFPTAVIGFLLHGVIKQLLGSTSVILASLFIGGIILIIFDPPPLLAKLWWVRKFQSKKNLVQAERMSFMQAFLVGVCQSISVIPGVSRSAATIIGGEWLGLSRTAIVDFSFLLAIPTMAAATGYDLLKTGSQFTRLDMELLAVGFVLSFLVALVSIKCFLHYVKNHSFAVFGIYRILLAVAGFIFLT